MPLGDEIAVLDGLENLGGLGMTLVEDGRIGRTPATGAEYARQPAHGVELRRNVIDPSEGANYSGGSSSAPGLPLMPSSIGLADADLISYMQPTGVLPPKKNVIDASGGALYSGGSSYAPGLPLLPSSAGLAGMGRMDKYSDFGRMDKYADFSECKTPMEMDRVFESLAGSSITLVEDGRIGRMPATGAEYARQPAHGVETRRNVIDPSEGANYSGGSSSAPGLPLMPSSIGLAELSVVDVLDGLSDNAFKPKLYENQRAAFVRQASAARIADIKNRAQMLSRAATAPSLPWPKRQAALNALRAEAANLSRARSVRRGIIESSRRQAKRAAAMAQPVREMTR